MSKSQLILEKRSDIVKSIASELGFSFCGISKSRFLKEEEPRLINWLKQGYNGKMAYMENHFDKRLDPSKLVDGTKSVISLLFNYFPQNDQLSKGNYKISKYAYGKDYHDVIRKKLKEFLSKMQEQIGESVSGRGFTDSAPILERAWAKQSGIGWVGKNGNLINKGHGSFFFLAELLVDIELLEDQPYQKDYCGSCTACIDACPTGAIVDNTVIDSNKCISYLTIELREAIPSEFKDSMDSWMYGCDVCQDVCPWNRFSKPHSEPQFEPNDSLKDMKDSDWEDLSEELFRDLFKGSAVKRTKFSGLIRNIKFNKQQT